MLLGSQPLGLKVGVVMCFTLIPSPAPGQDLRWANGHGPCNLVRAQLRTSIQVGHMNQCNWGGRAQALNLVTLPLTSWVTLDLIFLVCGSLRIPVRLCVRIPWDNFCKAPAQWLACSECSIMLAIFTVLTKALLRECPFFPPSLLFRPPLPFPSRIAHLGTKTWDRIRDRSSILS